MYELKVLITGLALAGCLSTFPAGLPEDVVRVDRATAGMIQGGSGQAPCDGQNFSATLCCAGKTGVRNDVYAPSGHTHRKFGDRICVIIAGGGCTFTAGSSCNN